MVALSLNLSFYIIENCEMKSTLEKYDGREWFLLSLLDVHEKYLCIILNGLNSKLISGVVFNIFLRAITCVIIKI